MGSTRSPSTFPASGHHRRRRTHGEAPSTRALEPVVAEMATPLVVIGHSFGGRVAVHLAPAWPDRVAGVVLAGVPLLRVTAPSPPALSFRIAKTLNRIGLLSDEKMEERRRQAGSTDYRASTGVMRDVFVRLVHETYEEQLKHIAAPVELVWGDDDTAAPVLVAQRGRAPRASVDHDPSRSRPSHAADGARRAAARDRAPAPGHVTAVEVVATAAGAIGFTVALLRWLRVAQREHYLPGR